jgi:hypothetical protein
MALLFLVDIEPFIFLDPWEQAKNTSHEENSDHHPEYPAGKRKIVT